MRIATLAVLAALPLLAACGHPDVPSADAVRAGAKQLTIGMAGSQFGPATAEVHAGDTVVFRNDDAIAHTATANEGGRFDSGTMAPGATFSYVARRTGRVSYLCQFHPGMTGTLTVR
jgi:plastocyanin